MSAQRVEWRYLGNDYARRGSVAHAILVGRLDDGRAASVCGQRVNWYHRNRDRWLGAGSDEERATLAELRPCRHCAAWLPPDEDDEAVEIEVST